MDHDSPGAPDARIVEAMIDLTRLKRSHRTLIAGCESLNVYLALRSRGFTRIATIATCRGPCKQHDVGFIAGEHSTVALEALIAQVAHYLTPGAMLAVWIGSRDTVPVRTVRSALHRLGFRIEAAASCDRGRVLSARRDASGSLEMAA
jgi:hypothetical protein